jgi:mannosyltransferase
LFRGREWILLLTLLLLAFALRIYHLDSSDISGDEAWSITVAGWPLSEIVSSDAETNPPLYHVLLHAMMRFGGTTPFAIRYLSVLSGFVALAFIYRAGKASGGGGLGLTAVAAGAASPFLIYYAQDARMYGMALLGASGSVATFVMLVQKQQSGKQIPRGLWAAHAITSMIGVYSHYYVFAILVAEGIFVVLLLIRRRLASRLKPWLTTWVVMAATFLPWPLIHVGYLQGKASGRFEEWTAMKLAEIGRRTFVAYGIGITVPPADAWRAWIVGTLALLGLLILLRRPQTRRYGVLFTFVLLIGVAFAWLVNPIMPFFYERYLLVGMPAFLLLLAAGLTGLFRIWKPAALLTALLVLGISAPSVQNQFFDSTYDKGGYGRLMAAIESRAQRGDVMLLNNPLQASLFDYYGAIDVPASVIDRGNVLTDEDANSQMAKLTAGYQRVWLVETGNPITFDPEHRVQRWLGLKGSRGIYENYGNGNILHLFFLTAAGQNARQDLSANISDQILLTGFSHSAEVARAGETLLLTLYWQGLVPIERGYTVFTHVVDGEGVLRSQTDGQPGGGARPTNSWEVGEIVEDNYAVLLPEDLPSGQYRLRVGMYLWPELTRLPVVEADKPIIDDSIELDSITVWAGD